MDGDFNYEDFFWAIDAIFDKDVGESILALWNK
jgi:hypothetical protein